MQRSTHPHLEALLVRGWALLPDFIDRGLLAELADAMAPSLAMRDAIRRENGVTANADGTLHHLLADAPCYVELLSALEPLTPIFDRFFEGKYILNSYGGVANRSQMHAYVQEIHRDIRFGTDAKRFMLNALVMLDDFTLENGATHLLPGSQHLPEKPGHEAFYAEAERATGTAGSVLLFDSRVWHAAGINHTSSPRRALTLTFTCPFFKQQLDYPRLFGYDRLAGCDAWLRQLIGFNARTPESLNEFYVPVEQRFYQRGQD
ncbi:MAG: phytanoyl-CoA dioxygenase family protein [Paraburkholderia tropica]|uniref:phytanoyl-CoA dioxygenase family protein n=1 Tax=Burkholderia gladioli TaxID=28095 RepID=UPI00163E57AB|nr:phytanoyl-CoA dioxygenase family protein [Burkholderia gladioli]URV25036.1 phytanoyl-CoA dioxygenase family protein [Burkholderia gladioli]